MSDGRLQSDYERAAWLLPADMWDNELFHDFGNGPAYWLGWPITLDTSISEPELRPTQPPVAASFGG